MIDYNKNDIFWRDFINLSNNPYKLNTDLSKFKCLLVYLTRKGDFSGWDYPLPLGYMASLLRMNGAKATIHIQDIDAYDSSVFSGYNLICFYPTVALLSQTLAITKKIKKDLSNSNICLFNSDQHQHEMLLCNPRAADFAGEIIKRHHSIDYILVGEAESSFLKLCEKLITDDYNFDDVPSCLYRKSGQAKLSEKQIEPVNFEFLPFPSRDFLEKGVLDGLNTRSVRIQSSRGCVSPCLYCAESSSNITKGGRKKPLLNRDIVKFVDEIELLSKHYKVIFFNIIDSSFEDPGHIGIKRMMQFCDEIINRKIQASFKIHLRVETISKLEDSFLLKLKDAGVDIIGLGVESGIERELRSYNKITTVKENIDNIHQLDKSDNFFSVLGHMMFSPILRLEDLPKKIKFLREIHHGWDYLDMSNNVLVFPGTAYQDYLERKGLTKKCDALSGVIPYTYEDERVKFLAEEMGSLKIKCPAAVLLNNLLYDAQNISARYSNKINEHLWENETAFRKFKEELKKILYEVENVYTSYFLDLVELAELGWSSEKADLIYKKHIPGFFPERLDKTKQLISNLIASFKNRGLSTNTLYLKTWMSLINAQINTSGGRVG